MTQFEWIFFRTERNHPNYNLSSVYISYQPFFLSRGILFLIDTIDTFPLSCLWIIPSTSHETDCLQFRNVCRETLGRFKTFIGVLDTNILFKWLGLFAYGNLAHRVCEDFTIYSGPRFPPCYRSPQALSAFNFSLLQFSRWTCQKFYKPTPVITYIGMLVKANL